MTMAKRNLLLIMSDQHSPKFAGFAGHPQAITPNLDRLAASGRVFKSAYCTSPICVPSRASIATGRYVHDIGTWDNAAPYVGDVSSWGHHLDAAGYRVTTIGKLHFRTAEDDTGYPDQRYAMHIHGKGDLLGISHRPDSDTPRQGHGSRNIRGATSGESDYTRFDGAVADEAVRYLAEESADEPWALMVSFVAPHFPLVAPQEFFDLYRTEDIVLPSRERGPWDHPEVDVFLAAFGLIEPFTDDEIRNALHAYLALCSFMDSNVGRVLDALEANGHGDDTLVVYTSDHGESAGAHGLWFKHLMNDESVGVPLIVAGPDLAPSVVGDPVSHVDLFTTFLGWAGIEPPDVDLPGVSLLTDASPLADRTVMAEYHANGTIGASFMVRWDRYKYIEYINGPPQLFDLVADPHENTDLSEDLAYAETVSDGARRLREICDPVSADAEAKRDQRARVDAVGGRGNVDTHTVPFTPVPTTAK
jgi:choline-sulfatase